MALAPAGVFPPYIPKTNPPTPPPTPPLFPSTPLFRSQGIDIGPGIRAPGPVLLGRGEPGGHGLGPRGCVPPVIDNLGQSKIDQDCPAVGGDFDVPRLDVSMEDRRRSGMEIGEGLADLEGPCHRLGFRHRAAAFEALA